MSGQGAGAPPPASVAVTTEPRIARVVLESPLPQLDHLFDYGVPDGLLGAVRPGVRVTVPLRGPGRTAGGFVVDLAAESAAPGRLSDIDGLVSSVPVLAPEVWRLVRAVADRAAGTASDVLRLAVPKRQVRVEKAWLSGPAAVPRPAVEAPLTDRAVALLAGSRLVAEAVPRLREVGAAWLGGWAAELAETAAGVLAAGRSVVLAVPDHRDLDQLLAALAAGPAAGRVVRVDAAQPAAARYRAHLAGLGTEPLVVVGNRSAVYAPVPDLGALAVWDEADPLHREPLAPYATTRDVALLRQEQSGCGLLLLSHARSSTAERLVRVGWAEGAPPVRPIPRVVLTPDDEPARRIPSTAWRDVQRATTAGPVLVQVARPGDAALRALREGVAPPPIDAGRTAHELGRAFPGVRVVLADGDHPLGTVPAEPVLVVATRGAEPRADGGYRAVLLLDGRRMLARESLWVAEDCLRWWSNAAALAAADAPVHLVGVGGDVATALATWRSADFAGRQLADRQALRFPPAVRLGEVSGAVALADPLLVQLAAAGAEVITRSGTSEVRAVVRFGYGAGPPVAGAVRAGLIRAATAPRARGAAPARPRPTIRVRLDIREPVPDDG